MLTFSPKYLAALVDRRSVPKSPFFYWKIFLLKPRDGICLD